MSSKRALDDSPAPERKKKKKKGFQVGPANLPDGTWRRKNQKIKRDLIERAQIKKSYAKLKERENIHPSNIRYDELENDENSGQEGQENQEDGVGVQSKQGDSDEPDAAIAIPASLELHPDRQQMVDNGAELSKQEYERPRPRIRKQHGGREEGRDGALQQNHSIPSDEDAANGKEATEVSDVQADRYSSKRKSVPFSKEAREAERRRKEAEQRAKEREEAQRARKQKLDERERHRRAMAKARSGGRNGQRKLGRESKVLLDKVKRLMSNDN